MYSKILVPVDMSHTEKAADMIHAAVVFEVQDIRPIVDFGQGWEKSV